MQKLHIKNKECAFCLEGATCHYTWYVPHNVEGLIEMQGGPQKFEDKAIQRVAHILDTEYNDTSGGLSGNDDAGQMSAWYVFSSLGFYPVCPATDKYMLSAPRFQKVTLNLQGGKKYVITPQSLPKDRNYITHGEILQGN